MGDGLAEREEARLEALDEQRQPEDHAHKPDEHAAEVRERLLQDDDLEEGDHDDDWREIPHRAEQAPGKRDHRSPHGRPFRTIQAVPTAPRRARRRAHRAALVASTMPWTPLRLSVGVYKPARGGVSAGHVRQQTAASVASTRRV